MNNIIKSENKHTLKHLKSKDLKNINSNNINNEKALKSNDSTKSKISSSILSNNNSIYVNVLVKDKTFRIYCGNGTQRIRWLTDCAIFKYETFYYTKCGLAYGLKLENGENCNLESLIKDVLKNNENVWILLKEEYYAFKEDGQDLSIENSEELIDNNSSNIELNNVSNNYNNNDDNEVKSIISNDLNL